MFKRLFTAPVVLILTVFISLSEQPVQAQCDPTLAPSTEKSASQISDDTIVTDWSGFDNIDWNSITGWGALKQKPVFSNEEISLLRKGVVLYEYKRGRYSDRLGIEFMNLNIRTSKRLKIITHVAGSYATLRFKKYLTEIDSKIKTKTNRPYSMSVWIRNENSDKVSDGHRHSKKNTLTITRAEEGENSWFVADGSDHGTRTTLSDPNATTVFTNQFHGGTKSRKPRLLIIISIDFDEAHNVGN